MPQSTHSTLSDLPLLVCLLIPVVAWLLAWVVQVNLPIFDYAPFVAIVFFPAGVRTLAVLVFGWRGALGVAIGTLITYLWFFDDLHETVNLFNGVMLALASGFSALLVFKLVQWWQRIPTDLHNLRLKHILIIVISQGLLSATLHQLIYHASVISPFYEKQTLDVCLQSWLAMAVGDTLGSMLLLYTIAIAARWAIQRATYSEPRS